MFYDTKMNSIKMYWDVQFEKKEIKIQVKSAHDKFS